MDFMWVNVLVICCGLRGVVATHSDGYIGCYWLMSSDLYTSFSDNSGRICKNHCFPQYRYAGTSSVRCYCMERLTKHPFRQMCTAQCPGRTYGWEACGGMRSMTVYDAQKTTTTHSTTTTSTTTSAMLKTSKTQSVTSTVNFPTVNTKPKTDKVLTTDETTANSTTSTSFGNMSIPGCVFICVAVAVAVCMVIINIAVLCVCKKNRRSKRGHKAQIDNDGYISPVNVTELDDPTPHVNTLQLRNEVTTHSAGKSSNMYEDLSSKAAESQYTDLV